MINRLSAVIWVIVVILLTTVFSTTKVHASSSRTVTLNYQTVYHHHTYHKQALVYLPAGYSNQHRYNTIYLLHGSTETPREFYQDGNFKQVLDRLIVSDQLPPSIVIFPTYYPDRSFVSANYYRDRRLNRAFAQHELVHDLLPAVAQHYRTYASGSDNTALKKARNHRAFGGFSMGAITTWYVFQYQLPYFNSYLPVAGDAWNVKSDGGSVAPKQTAKLLSNVVQSHPHLPFRIFAAVGTQDGTSASMTPQIQAMRRTISFSKVNLSYYRVSDGAHTPRTVNRAFSHFADQLFSTHYNRLN